MRLKRPVPVTQPPCPQASRRELAEGYALEAPEETAEMTAIGRACLSLPFDLSNLASWPNILVNVNKISGSLTVDLGGKMYIRVCILRASRIDWLKQNLSFSGEKLVEDFVVDFLGREKESSCF